MLTKVRVQHFQSLQDTTVELGTLTVIVGPNDNGKSAFFRAVRAAAEAQAGTDFIKRGHQTARVTLFVEGHELVWEKGAQTNKYMLDGVLFERVGKQTPPEIAELLAMSTVEFDKDLKLNLNFADQDDPPFLIPFPGGITSSKVAKVLGDLTNLSVLFKAIAEAENRRRQEDSEAKVRASDAEDKRAQLTAFEDLDVRETRIIAMESKLHALPPLQQELRTLEMLRGDRERLRVTHTQIEAAKAALPPDLSADLSKISDLVQQLAALKGVKGSIATFHEQKGMLDVAQKESQARVDAASQALEKLKEEIGVCPLCGHKMDGDHGHPQPANA